jgi:hypothetical protein
MTKPPDGRMMASLPERDGRMFPSAGRVPNAVLARTISKWLKSDPRPGKEKSPTIDAMEFAKTS